MRNQRKVRPQRTTPDVTAIQLKRYKQKHHPLKQSHQQIPANQTLNDSYDDTGALEKLKSDIVLDLYGHNASFLATTKTIGIGITYAELKRKKLGKEN